MGEQGQTPNPTDHIVDNITNEASAMVAAAQPRNMNHETEDRQSDLLRASMDIGSHADVIGCDTKDLSTVLGSSEQSSLE